MPDGDRIRLVRDWMLCEDLMTTAERTHRCDESCVCPVHGNQMYWWPKGQEHACQNITCRYARGFEVRYMADFIQREFGPFVA